MPTHSSSANRDPWHVLLGIAPEHQPADYYRMLGIEQLEFITDVIRNAAARQIDHLNRHATGDFQTVTKLITNNVLLARDCLLDHDKHLRYAAELQGFEWSPSDPASQADLRSFCTEFDRAWHEAQTTQPDPMHHWLGIPPTQRPVSNFRLLGVSPGEQDLQVIQNSAERQIAFVRKFAIGAHSEEANDLLRQLGRAKSALVRKSGSRDVPSEDSITVQTRVDPPEPVAITLQPRSDSTTHLYSSRRSRVHGKITRKRRTNVFVSAIAWVLPFVVPGAAIYAYVKLTGNGDQQLRTAIAELSRAAEIDGEDDASSLKARQRDIETNAIQSGSQRSLPSQTHAKPDSVNRNAAPIRSIIDRPSDRQSLELKHANSHSLESIHSNANTPKSATPNDDDNRETEPKFSAEPLFFREPRPWRMKQGQTFDATVVELNRDQVSMKNAENGREAQLLLENFIAEDERLLRTTYLDLQDQDQFSASSGIASYATDLSDESAEILGEHHTAHSDSPYAGLWLAVAKANHPDQISTASIMLKKVVERVDYQREIDSNRHSMTLSSALNNLAVCMIMEHKTSAAAVMLSRALDTMPASSPTILHNSQFLLKLGSQKDSPLKLNVTSNRKLKSSLQLQPISQSGLRDNWYFSLDVDLPTFTKESRKDEANYFSQQSGIGSKLIVRHTLCVACQGVGHHVCRNCSKGVVPVQRQTQVGVNRITNEPIKVTKVFRVRCNNCNGKGNIDCKYCDAGRLP